MRQLVIQKAPEEGLIRNDTQPVSLLGWEIADRTNIGMVRRSTPVSGVQCLCAIAQLGDSRIAYVGYLRGGTQIDVTEESHFLVEAIADVSDPA